jgi:hypothetical protein
MREVFDVVVVVGEGGGFCLCGYDWASVWCVYWYPRGLAEMLFGGVVRSIESVFFCGCVLSVVISICLVVGVYSGGGRPFAILEDSNPRCTFRPRLVIVLLGLRVLRTHTVRSPSLAC